MNRRLLALITALLCVGQTLRGADDPPLQLQWSELAPRITGRRIAMVLPDGTHVEGKVVSATAAGLHLRVAKTSNRKTMHKGQQLIPRASVSLLRVTEYRTRARVITTSAAVAVPAGIVAANYPDIYEGPLLIIVPAVIAGGLAGLAVAGYFIGKRLDKVVTEIRIVPDRQSPPVPSGGSGGRN